MTQVRQPIYRSSVGRWRPSDVPAAAADGGIGGHLTITPGFHAEEPCSAVRLATVSHVGL